MGIGRYIEGFLSGEPSLVVGTRLVHGWVIHRLAVSLSNSDHH